ncbi:MAG: gfo/Idh/MocA family oxidoreductase [Planctomycetota bacterium]|nr:MAG: gfo/Idh/MocA family oxidoreductase [Planctomycetota bacterium]
MEPLKIAVIGVGHLGKEHARVLKSLENAYLAAIVDTNPEQGRIIQEKVEVPLYLDYKELPKDIQAVSIATPTIYHFEIAKYFLERDVHVMIEKPMTTNAQEARELVEIAQKRNLKIQVGHIERFNPALQGLLKYIENPRFIQAHRLSPYSFRSTDVSVIHDLMIHDIDIVLELAKSEVEEVEALGLPVLSSQEDLANVRLKFANGCIADITANRVGLKKMRQIRLFQKNAYLTLDYMTKRGRIFQLSPDFHPSKIKDISPPTNMEEINALVFGEFILMEELAWEGEEPLKAELQSFVEAILQDKEPKVPGQAGLRAIEIVEAIFESIQKNLWRKDIS